MMRRLLATSAALLVLGIVAVGTWLHRSHDWNPFAALAVALAIPVATIAGVLGTQFAIGAFFRARESDESHGYAASLRAWAAEIVAALRTYCWAQIRHADSQLPSADAGPGTPILLVHGYLCNRGIWHPFARWLAARGHPVDSVNLEPVFGTIDDYVPIVAEAVRRLRRRSGRDRVAIVAHSMGGVVARAYLAREGAGSVCSVVTLGSPHAGTWFARWGHGANVGQMRVGCDWLCALEKRETPATGALFTTIWSPHDNIVIPQKAAQRLPGATAVAVPARGHLQLAYDAEVWRIAADAVDSRCGAGGLRSGSRASAAATQPGPESASA